MIETMVLSIVKWFAENLMSWGMKMARLSQRLEKIDRDIVRDAKEYHEVVERVKRGEATDEELKDAARRYLNGIK